MSEPNAPEDAAVEDGLRQHAEPAVEGAGDADAGEDQPREHTEDPAEG